MHNRKRRGVHTGTRGIVLCTVVALAACILALERVYPRSSGTVLPAWLNYQGRLTSPEGAAIVDGQYDAVFKIFDSPTGGNLLWSEGAQIAAIDGVFSTTLGQGTPFPNDLFRQRLWLQTEIEGRTLVPRQELGAVAYAMTAQTAMSLPPDTVDSSMIEDGQVMSADIADGAVIGAKIPGGSIAGAHLADGSVTSTKVADGSIGTDKIQDGAVLSGKIGNGAVTSSQLASDPASLFKVSNGSLSALPSNGLQTHGNTNLQLGGLVGHTTSDAFIYDGKPMGHYSIGWFADSWSSGAATQWVSGFAGIKFFTTGVLRMSISNFGAVRVYGNLQVDGSKNNVVKTKSYGERLMYASEAPSSRFFDEGVGELMDGSVVIKLDPIFLETIEGEYVVHLTPYGDSFLYVSEIGRDRFVVRSRRGEPDVRFAWRLSAFRKGYANVRLARAQ